MVAACARVGVHGVGEVLVLLEGIAANRVLQRGNVAGVQAWRFAAHAEGVFAADFECACQHRIVAESRRMPLACLAGDFAKADALDLWSRCR